MGDASEAPPKLVLGPRRERFPFAGPSPLTWNSGAPCPPRPWVERSGCCCEFAPPALSPCRPHRGPSWASSLLSKCQRRGRGLVPVQPLSWSPLRSLKLSHQIGIGNDRWGASGFCSRLFLLQYVPLKCWTAVNQHHSNPHAVGEPRTQYRTWNIFKWVLTLGSGLPLFT